MASQRNPRICFIIPYPVDQVPGQRFRFEQYLPMLRDNGMDLTIHPFLDIETNRILYQKGFYIRKITGVLTGIARRLDSLLTIRSADMVFIFREAAPLGPPLFEWIILTIFRKKVIYDFDDSIWLTDQKHENWLFRILKWRSKVMFICKRSYVVSCGNEYLASFARRFNKHVIILPTTIDTDNYKPINNHHLDPVVIGWSGSITTIEHFVFAIPILKALRKKYGASIAFKVIGDSHYKNKELDITGIAWSKSTEVNDLTEITIGIMPLPDDPWTRGKCGLKGLQYMALEIPTVMSGVGVNREIIQDGINGFIADNDEEWIEKISRLIEDPSLRRRMGTQGRKTVEERFSTLSQRDNYLSLFGSAIGPSPA